MANATPTRLGQINAGGSATALFLKVFPGEVLKSFNAKNKVMPLTMVRDISSGVSAQFPMLGTTSTAYHVVGAEITGQIINENEIVIKIDDLLLTSAFIASLDDAMNHYQVRGEYARQMGEALSLAADKRLLQVGVLAARAAAIITGGNGGTALINANYGTVGATLAAGFYSAAQKLDEKNVPEDDRFGFLKPAQYYVLVQETDVIDSDWNGEGSYAKGTVAEVAGIKIIKTNNLPTTLINAITGEQNTYNADFSTTIGLVMHKSAVGTVRLMKVATEQAYDIRRQGTLMVAKMAIGHGFLRPECAVELKTS